MLGAGHLSMVDSAVTHLHASYACHLPTSIQRFRWGSPRACVYDEAWSDHQRVLLLSRAQHMHG